MSAKNAVQGPGAWSGLREAATAVAKNAYCPYSSLGVGAAAFVVPGGAPGTDDDPGTHGRIVTGCNVENASLGLTLCAECGVVSAATATGGGRLARLVVTDAVGKLLSPCGRCRQLLFEHGGPGLEIQTDDGPVLLGALLPGAFGPGDLP